MLDEGYGPKHHRSTIYSFQGTFANWHPADGVFDSNNFLARAVYLNFFAVVDWL